MTRSIRPLDLRALLRFNRWSPPNEVRTRRTLTDRPGEPLPLRQFVREWLMLDENAHTWVETEDRQVEGLITVRSRSGSAAWEVERLRVLGSADPVGVGLALLDRATMEAGSNGVRKLFLRVPTESIWVEVARHAGFSPLAQEWLYVRAGPSARRVGETPREAGSLRPRQRGDEQALFQLYCDAVPAPVRQREALTLNEWSSVRDEVADGWRRLEEVLVQDDRIVGWLRVAERGSAGQFDVIVRPGHEPVNDLLLGRALNRLAHRPLLLTLVPEYFPALERAVVERRFEPVQSYVRMVKPIAVRLRAALTAPARREAFARKQLASTGTHLRVVHRQQKPS